MIEDKSIRNIERAVGKLFLFCLPFRMITQLSFLSGIFHGLAFNLDFIFNVIGVFLYLLNSSGKIYFTKDKASHLFKYFISMVLILNVLTFIMACFIQIVYGNYAGESAFSGIIGMELYFFQYILIIAYCRRIFYILTIDEIKKVLEKICLFLLLLGYYQLLGLAFGGFFTSSLRAIDILGILTPPNVNMWKLSLTGIEGAAAGTIFSVLVIPFLLSRYLESKSPMYIVLFLLWMPVLVMMKSTSAYLMAMAATGVFLLILMKNLGHLRNLAIPLLIVLVLVFFIFLLGGEVLKSILPDDIYYLIFSKALDRSNGSTVSRTVPFVTNFNIFKQFPIIGCGNGLQGYFYTTYFPDWARNVAGSDVMNFYYKAQNTIVNGGVFFPGFLSGYGCVGIALLFVLIIKIKKRLPEIAQYTKFPVHFFLIAIGAILVCGFQGEFAGEFIIWFAISLVFVDWENIVEY